MERLIKSTIRKIEINPELEFKVSELLLHIGVPAHLKGYHYIRDAVVYSVQDPEIVKKNPRKIYSTVAKKYETTASRVERGIHHAIDVAWKNSDEDTLNSYFCLTDHISKIKPTNLEFISMLSDKLSI